MSAAATIECPGCGRMISGGSGDWLAPSQWCNRCGGTSAPVAAATVWTFAYGMNMVPELISGAISGQAGMLPGWRLEYRQFADVVPDPDGVVPGVLWQIPAWQLRRLDEREGYPALYDRQLVDVLAADGSVVAAWVYRMTERTVASYAAQGGCPISWRYRQWMIEGRTAFGLTTDDIPEEGS